MTGAHSLRIDKWLWYARFVRSRSRAVSLIAGGGVRLNRQQVAKASAAVAPGDLITLVIGTRVHAIEVIELGARRGPASEARCLYRDLTGGNGPKDAHHENGDDTEIRPLNAPGATQSRNVTH